MDTLIILIAPAVAIFTAILAARRPMPERQRSMLMMILGFGIVTFGIVSVFATEQPAVSAVAAVGLVFIAIGARRMRAAA